MLREMPYFMENEDWYETPPESSGPPWFPDGRGITSRTALLKKQRKAMRSTTEKRKICREEKAFSNVVLI